MTVSVADGGPTAVSVTVRCPSLLASRLTGIFVIPENVDVSLPPL